MIKYLPYLLAVIPQILFKEYTWIVFSTIAIGFLSSLLIGRQQAVFLKIFIAELIVFGLLFFVSRDHVLYFDDVFKNLGISTALIPIVFIVFNVLNISLLFYFGYKVHNLFIRK